MKIKKELFGKGCYWCGKKPISVEHCPPQNTFKVSKEPIKLPACKIHNEDYSKIDERMGYFFKIISGYEIEKTLHKLTKDENYLGLFNKINNKMSYEAEIVNNGILVKTPEPNDVPMYLEKITRGLLYYHVNNKIGKLGIDNTFRVTGNNLINYNTEYSDIIEDVFKNIQMIPNVNDFFIDGAYEKENENIFKYKYFMQDGFFSVYLTFYNHLEFKTIIKYNIIK